MMIKKNILSLLLFIFFFNGILSANDVFPCLENVTISTASGETSLLSCQGDDVDGVVKFKTSTQAMPFAYVVTDEEGTILWLTLSNNIDLSPYQDGAFRIYAFSFLGSLLAEVGDNIFATELASYCYELTTNYVSINNGAPDAGSISTTGTTLVCVGDGNPDLLDFTNTGSGDDYVYFATDQNNVILGISADGSFDFDTFGEGTYFIWGYTYFGNLTAMTGMDITLGGLSDGCDDFSDGFIAITASNPDGGTVTLENGSTSYDLCDGLNADILTFNFTTTSQAPYVLVLVDANDIITNVLSGNTLEAGSVSIGTSYIYGISYTGINNITPGTEVSSQLSDDCYELSDNFVTLFKEEYQAGSVSLENGDTETTLCVSDGEADILNFLATGVSGGEFFTFIITDDQNNVLDFSNNGSLDFDTAPAGTCRIWGLTYDGNLLVAVDDNLDNTILTDACYGLSSNFITVNRQAVNGGFITFTNNGESYLEYCSSEEPVDLGFSSVGSIGENFRYVTTDEFGNITGIHPVGTTISPVTIFSYTRYIYWLSFIGDDFTGDEIAELSGQNIETALLRDGCYQLSSNRAELRVSFVDGGSVQLENGETTTVVCSNDQVNDILTFETNSNSVENQTLLLTDAANNIITFITGNSINFEAAANGDYRIWSVSYTGDIIAQINDPAHEVALSDGCYELSENFVEIFKTDVEGGTVSTLAGDTFLMICPDGDAPASMNFTNANAIGNGYGYILTDEDGVIVSVLDGNTFEFSSIPVAGILHFWGVAYTGVLDVPFGENIQNAVLSNECYDLSDNFVEIIYENAQAGTLTVNGGLSEISLCVGDGIADVVEFEVTDATHLNYAYLLTDIDGFLIGVLFEDNFDFDNAIGGEWRIYGLSYSGFLNLFPGDNIFDITPSDDCWDYTQDYVTLIKNAVDGGIVFTDIPDDIIYVCAGDGEADIISFSNSSSANEANYQYILTTAENLILSFVTGEEQDFEDTGFTTLRVWGLSYTGNLNMEFGASIDQAVLSDECYTLSDNFLTVIRDLPEGGDLATTDGEVVVEVCVGAGPGTVEVVTTSTSASGYVYLLLNDTGVIVEVNEDGIINFNNIDPGLYRVWGLSYTGALYAEPGLLATQVELSGSCYELSNNFVEVTRSESVDGGMISVNGSNETTFFTCPGDGLSDLIVLETTSIDTNYSYIITDTNDMVIIPQIIGSAIDFNNAPNGEVRIYGISFNGNSTVSFGVNILEDALSDNCYTHSENYITVFIAEPVGGTVTSDQGNDVTVVVGDGEEDLLTFSSDGTSTTPYVYVITNENNEILDFVTGDNYDFEETIPGISRVWGVAYTGSILAFVGDILTDINFSDDCYSVSENYVIVNRTDDSFTEGGTNAKRADNSINYFINLKTYPNPAAYKFTASFEMKQTSDSNAQIIIMSTAGQIVKQFYTTTVEGQNEIEVAIDQLLPGLYLLQIRNEYVRKSVRFSKQ